MTDISTILLTGKPGIGKTTLIREIIEHFPDVGGFYTREVRQGNVRGAFEIVTLDGKIGTLAALSTDTLFENEANFGRFKVNLDTVNQIANPAVQRASEQNQLVLIDEIGPMEIFSPQFQDVVMQVLDNNKLCVFGTIVERPYEFADDIKQHPQVKIISINEENRDYIKPSIINELHQILNRDKSG